MKAVSKILVILAVIFAVLIVGRNFIVKAAIENGGRVATGLPINIGKLNIGLASTKIDLKDIKVYNPKGFPKDVMFHAPEIFVDYKLGALLTGKIHVKDIRLDFDKLVIVKNENRQTNLEALKPKAREGKSAKEAVKKEPGKKQKAPDVQIDHLSLKVGSVIYKDYSKGGEPKVTEYKIGLNEEMHNITNPQSLAAIVMAKALMKTPLTALMGSMGEGVMDGISGVATGAADTIKGATEGASDTLKGATDTLKTIKLPFGGE